MATQPILPQLKYIPKKSFEKKIEYPNIRILRGSNYQLFMFYLINEINMKSFT